MSKFDDKDEGDVEIDECDKCHKSMTPNEFAFISDEDSVTDTYSMEFLNRLDSKKYHKLCHTCLKELKAQESAEEAEAYEDYEDIVEAINKQASEQP